MIPVSGDPGDAVGERVLEASRLLVRELHIGDLDFVAEMLAHPEVMRSWPRCYSRSEALDWVRRQLARYARDGYGYWLAVARGTGEPVGQVGLVRAEIDGEDEFALGYMLHRPHWGLGLATEAASACLDWGFERTDADRIVAPVRPENRASAAVARRLGMTPGRSTMFGGFVHVIHELARSEREQRRSET